MSKKSADTFKHELSVGEVAKRAGIAVSTLHFYEQKGLIASRRSEGNQRRYTRDVLRRVSVIKVAQKLGIPLADIQKALKALPKNKAATGADWQELSNRWKADLEERIHKLTLLKTQLTHCIGCGCLATKECPLRNPGDILADEGSGARLLE